MGPLGKRRMDVRGQFPGCRGCRGRQPEKSDYGKEFVMSPFDDENGDADGLMTSVTSCARLLAAAS
jgi:hypothetical protein